MSGFAQLKESLLRSVSQNIDPQGFCIFWDDCDAEKERAITKLVADGLLKKTAYSDKDECRLEITSRGEQELVQIDQAAASAKPLAVVVNWLGAASRISVAALSFVAGALLSFFLSNVSPSLYCPRLPNSGVGFLAPCDLPDEGKTK